MPDESVTPSWDDDSMQADLIEPTHIASATELVTAALMTDPAAVMAVIGEMDQGELRSVAVALAILAGSFISVEAEDEERDPLAVWQEALQEMRTN